MDQTSPTGTGHDALETQGGKWNGGWLDQRKPRSNGPQATAHTSHGQSALEELLSYSEHEITISEAINEVWLYDSWYMLIGAKTSECLARHTLRLLLGP